MSDELNTEKQIAGTAASVGPGLSGADNLSIGERLANDAEAIACFVEYRTGLQDIRVNVVLPYAWSDRRPTLCGVAVWSDGRKGLSTFARAILWAFGWHFAGGLDATDYRGFGSEGMSRHRRLRACGCVEEAGAAEVISFPTG